MNTGSLNVDDATTILPWIESQFGIPGLDKKAELYEWRFEPAFEMIRCIRDEDPEWQADFSESEWLQHRQNENQERLDDCYDSREKAETRAAWEGFLLRFKTNPRSLPIIVTESFVAGVAHYYVHDGNHRFAEALHWGWSTIPAVVGRRECPSAKGTPQPDNR